MLWIIGWGFECLSNMMVYYKNNNSVVRNMCRDSNSESHFDDPSIIIWGRLTERVGGQTHPNTL